MSLTTAVAETQFTEQFRDRFERSGNDRLSAFRGEAFKFFEENGYPTPRIEDWKYTNVAAIGKETWRVASIGLEVSEIDQRSSDLFKRFHFDRNGFTALNQAFAEVVVVTIPKETKIEEPIEFSL